MAQRITRLTTDQKIAGSNPAGIDQTFLFSFLLNNLAGNKAKSNAPPGGLEPPTFRLTAERASRLRHGGNVMERARIQGLVLMSLLPPRMGKLWAARWTLIPVRYGLVVRIAGSHPAGPGSIPGNGILL
jgi:hypothetical protein